MKTTSIRYDNIELIDFGRFFNSTIECYFCNNKTFKKMIPTLVYDYKYNVEIDTVVCFDCFLQLYNNNNQ